MPVEDYDRARDKADELTALQPLIMVPDGHCLDGRDLGRSKLETPPTALGIDQWEQLPLAAAAPDPIQPAAEQGPREAGLWSH